MKHHDFSRPLDFRRTRLSTYARDGSNADTVKIDPDETWAAFLDGPGEIMHMWFAIEAPVGNSFLKDLRVLAWFDGEEYPNIDAPFGEMFGLGHGEMNDVYTMAFEASQCDIDPDSEKPQRLGAFNFWLTMPFRKSARIEFRNNTSDKISLGTYIDCAHYHHADEVGPYHFNITRKAAKPQPLASETAGEERLNTSAEDNYTILNIEGGEGTYVGSMVSVRSTKMTRDIWMEGDDMIFIDGHTWPPALHGTGTIDYFNLTPNYIMPTQARHHGFSFYKSAGDPERPWDGEFTLYRLHLLDPLPFRSSLHATLEHGHANCGNAEYTSVAFWYGNGHDSNATVVPPHYKAKFGNPGR